MSRHPEVKWAQRVDKVYITVVLPDAKDVKVNLEPEGHLTFSATAGSDNNKYELDLNLYDKVNVQESKINVGVRSIFGVVQKATQGWWKKLLRGDDKAPHYLKVDWDKWVDEDDDEIGNDMDMAGLDFSKFGDGMGEDIGMSGDAEDSESEDEEVEKQEMAVDDEKAELAMGEKEKSPTTLRRRHRASENTNAGEML